MTTIKKLALCVTLIFLGGCATDLHSSSQQDAPPVIYQPGELNGQTLFDILSAELAAKQSQYAYTLEKYLKQADLTKDPSIAKRAVRIAQHLRDTQALTRAVELWLLAEANSVEANQLMANLLLRQGKFNQALPHFNLALGQGKKQMLILLSSEAGRMNNEDINNYISLLDNAEQSTALTPQILLTKAILQRQLGENDSALINLDSALKLAGDLPTAYFQKADILKQLSRYDDALVVVEHALKKQPESRQFSAMQIQLLFLLEREQEALDKLNTLAQANESDHQLLTYLALTAFDFKQLSVSEQIFAKLLRLSPAQTAPHYFLGIIAEQRKEIGTAIKHYLKVRQGNNLIPAHNRAVSLHTSAQDKDKIATITKSAIARTPSQKTSFILAQADWLNRFDTLEQAIALLSDNIALDPKNTELLYSRAMYFEPSNFNAAEKDFRAILALEPDNAVVLNAFGYTLTLRTTRFEEAKELITRALKINPQDPATLDSMGWVLFKLERYEEAIKYLSQAFELFKDPEVASHLIAALASQKRLADANKIFTLIKSSHPDSKFIEDARLAIEKNQ